MTILACPHCGRRISTWGNYCGQCGGVVGGGGGEMRSVGAAYGLWALWLLGVAGVHRFYAGRYLTGIIWLLTWGLFGIGQMVDLLLIPGMIEWKNRRLASRCSFQRA
ncbi:MAG: NINE protein [Phycisphaerae bacterium]|nr:NINE protein [Phycisphaerae bacterium]